MDNLKYCWQILYKNQAVVDGRKKPWYLSAILFVLGIFLTWIPIMSKGYTADNAAILTSSSNQEIDKGFNQIFQESYFRNLKFKSSNNEVSLTMEGLDDYASSDAGAYSNEYNGTNGKALAKGTFNDTATSTITNVSNFTGVNYYFDCISVDNSTVINKGSTSSTSSSVTYEDNGRTTYLEAFYFPTFDMTQDKSTTFRTNFISRIILDLDSSNTPQNYPHSYVIFFPNEIDMVVYSTKSAKSNSSVGSYSGSIRSAITPETASKYSSLYSYIYTADDGSTNTITKAYSKFHDFMARGATAYAIHTVWVNIGLVTAATVATELLVAVVLIIMHKRKTSTSRDTNFWETCKEAVAVAFSPCVIGMCIGFLNFSYELTAIIGCIVLRLVWMSSKICPPATSSGDNKPLYQARS